MMRLTRRRRRPSVFVLTAVAGAYFVFAGCWSFFSQDGASEDTITYATGRHLLQVESPANCSPRSIDQFPRDFLTWDEKRQGGIVIHISIALYMCLGIAIVCDDYFVSSLEVLSSVLALQPDVAGATFMAIGSSSPELFTSLIGVFLAKSDVGTGTIVGSAIFNILINLAVCGLFTGMVIYLTWWPVVRDCSFYLIAIIALVLIMMDEYIHWYEALALVLLYILYIVLMVFNHQVRAYLIGTLPAKSWIEEPLLEEKDPSKVEDSNYQSISLTESAKHRQMFEEAEAIPNGWSSNEGDSSDESYTSPLTFPDTPFPRFVWLLSLPLTICFVCTIPDPRKPGCTSRLYLVTLAASVVWIGCLTYILVWMVTVTGDVLDVPDAVMGLTFLAAGNSVPDILSSYFVARDGYGDMAVSNSIGSNIFDILIGLGLPWLLKTGIVSPASVVNIYGEGLVFTAITLVLTVLFLVIALLANGWKLDKKVATGCLAVYIGTIVMACLFSLNIFGDFNPPPCPRAT